MIENSFYTAVNLSFTIRMWLVTYLETYFIHPYRCQPNHAIVMVYKISTWFNWGITVVGRGKGVTPSKGGRVFKATSRTVQEYCRVWFSKIDRKKGCQGHYVQKRLAFLIDAVCLFSWSIVISITKVWPTELAYS